jgi:replication initiation protein RepC
VAATAGLVRSMLGISPDAWQKARADFGETGAAIVVAAILERAGDIRSPGGYLRSLSDKARAGKFSVWPMLEALHARK